ESVAASGATLTGRRIVWSFPERPGFALEATLELPTGSAEPLLSFRFTPRADAWYSVGYTGAPAFDPAGLEELWQPLIWQELRFPHGPFLTESFRCPLPATLATHAGVTAGVIADPSELPFDPLPTLKNAHFGVVLRNGQGLAQPALFAPILGGEGSR